MNLILGERRGVRGARWIKSEAASRAPALNAHTPEPTVQHVRLLAYGKSNSLPMLYRLGKDVPRLFEVVAGVSEAINLRSVFGPFLDPVVVTLVGDDWVSGFIGRLRHTLQIYLIRYSTRQTTTACGETRFGQPHPPATPSSCPKAPSPGGAFLCP